MGNFIKHTECPQCRQEGKDKHGNNLAIYDDGSSYCFSCGYYSPGSVITSHKNSTNRLNNPTRKTYLLPDDCTNSLPTEAETWLKNYSLTDIDIIKNNILWSEYYNRIIFPFFDENKNLIAYQGRYLGTENKPKWYSQGKLHELLHILGPKNTLECVLVEDIISAIRVSNNSIASMPIFGSHISLDILKRLKLIGIYSIYIWLDKDKQIEAIKFSKLATSIGLKSRTIITDKDPKAYSNEEIREILTE